MEKILRLFFKKKNKIMLNIYSLFLIYDGDGELIEELNVFRRPIAIYHVNDRVSFLLDNKEYIGTIAIVDAFGTFFDNSQPYYDIYIKDGQEKILVKHIPQSYVRKV